MTIAELYYGAEKSKEPRKNIEIIEEVLQLLNRILPYHGASNMALG